MLAVSASPKAEPCGVGQQQQRLLQGAYVLVGDGVLHQMV